MRTRQWNTCCCNLQLAIYLTLSSTIISTNCVFAQAIPDATLGSESSIVTPNTIDEILTEQIDGGAIRGANLFHSFEKFSVLNGSAVYFNNAADIQNIISRVTGSSTSEIDGLIQANNTANLFLINPNGIIFGANASLNTGGSFLASTANSITFADGNQFSATAPQLSPQLTISVPMGLQYQGTVQSITNQSQALDLDGFAIGLQVQPGKTIALVGGDVTLDGGLLQAAGGRIELGGLAGAGTVGLNVDGNNLRLSFPNNLEKANISLTNFAFVDANGEGGGDVQVQGRRVTLQDGSAIQAFTLGSEPGGTLTIVASDLVEVVGRTADGFSSGLATSVAEEATGNGGDLVIETSRLIIRDGAQIQAATAGSGQAGNLIIRATDSVELSRTSVFDNTISALATSTLSTATGDGGNLTIDTGRLIIQDGAQVQASTFGVGNGGTLVINASDAIELSGVGPTADLIKGSSGFFVSAEPGATGDVGNLRATTEQLVVQNGAKISADNFGTGQSGTATVNARELIIRDGGLVRAGSFGEGSGGTLIINAADSVEVSGTGTIGLNPVNSTLFTQAEAAGDAGDLNITTRNLSVRDGGNVTVSSIGSGAAGELAISARSVELDNNASLTATTNSGNGGNIRLQADDLLLLRRNSSISTRAGTPATGGGTGGIITIDTDNLVALENSDIDANAFGGAGGQVRISAQGIFGTQVREQQTPESDITASSDLGSDFSGTVEIITPDIDPSQGLVDLSVETVDASNQIAAGCTNDPNASQNKFAITGRGGLPLNPGDALSGDAVLTDWATLRETEVENVSSHTTTTSIDQNLPTQQIVEAQGWIVDAKGKVFLTAQAPDVTPNNTKLNTTSCNGS